MLLEGFRVRMYRSIRDSGFVPVFPLTALVGRHRSGKSSLLRALWGLGASSSRPFSLPQDWPSGSRQQRRNEHVVVSATFRLDEGMREELLARRAIGPGVQSVRVGRTYDGLLVAEACAPEVGGGDAARALPGVPPGKELAAVVRDRLPGFLFAAHDSVLPGALATDVLAEPAAEDEETGGAALSRLLERAGLRKDELCEELAPRHVREAGLRIRQLLEAAGCASGLALEAERGRILIFLDAEGTRTPLEQASKEERLRLTLGLRLADARSGDGRGTVLLLDGPARAFRREARARMRTLFDDYVRSGVTVLYTSRLPFEIELQHFEQVLVLAPDREGAMVAHGAPRGANELTLRAALGMTGRTSFRVDDVNLVVEGTSDARILRALDELLRRSGEPGLPDDLNLTSAQGAQEVVAVSAFLGRQGLGVVALFDSDSAGSAAVEQLKAAARDSPPMERVELLQIADAAGLEGRKAAIEDLFPLEVYLEVVRNVCGPAVPGLFERIADDPRARAEGNPAARLAKAFESHGRRYPKGEVIEALETKLASLRSIAELPPTMAEPARRLMQNLREAAARLRAPDSPARRTP